MFLSESYSPCPASRASPDQDPPALWIQKCLRSVKIKAMIERAVCAGFIAMEDKIAVVVNIFIVVTLAL